MTTLTLGGTSDAISSAQANSLRGVISDGSNGGKLAINKTGAGNWYLYSSSNTYSGGTTISQGNLYFESGSLGTGNVTFSGGNLRWVTANGANTTDLSSRIKNSSSAISVEMDNDVVFANSIDATNTGGLTKRGTGKLTLNGANAYTGTTTVAAGTLLINGSTAGGSVVVNSGATLGGTGTIGGATSVASGGILAAGASVGTLSVASLTLNSGSISNFEFNLSANDLVAVTGNLSLSGVIGLNLYNEGGTTQFATEGTYTLFTFGSLTGFTGSSFNVLNPDNAKAYIFTNTGSAIQLQIVPEPSTWLMLGLGALVLIVLRRRQTAVA